MTTDIGKYKQWQSAKDESGNFIIGKVNKVNKYLGGCHESDTWNAVNTYLPSREDEYHEYEVLSLYNKELDGILVQFRGIFDSEIVEIAKQVVFKLREGNDDVLVAEFIEADRENYTFEVIPADNFQILSWEMTRLKPGRDNVTTESALVCMKWAWDGHVDGQAVHEESQLLWAWDPYDDDL